jgi:hypothetical protein
MSGSQGEKRQDETARREHQIGGQRLQSEDPRNHRSAPVSCKITGLVKSETRADNQVA